MLLTEPRTRTRAATSDTGPRRDVLLDNAKYLLIVLVVSGHAWEPLRDGSRAVSAVYLTVYVFHMPAFILISGYLSRNFDAAPHRIRRLITGVAVPYVIFETAYSLFNRWAGDDPGQRISLLDPWYLTWFLVALLVWRLSTPLWTALRHPVPVALAIAALATVTPATGNDLDLQRVQQFLPFFVLGLVLRPEHLRALRRPEVRVLAALVLAGAAVLAYWLIPRAGTGWLYRRDSAQELGYSAVTGVLGTVVLFCCSVVLTFAFLALVPGRRMWFSALGAGSLYAYLLHGFLAQGSGYWGWYGPAWVHTPAGAATVTLLAAAVATLLCTAPVRRTFRFAVEPRVDWLFAGRAGADERARPPASRRS